MQQPILSAQQQESSLLSGRTVQVWRSSADRREQILHLLSMMRWLQPKQEMQTYFSAIQQDVFIIKRTLWKIYRILEREYPDAYLETLVVLDGTTGQNALAQARQFAEVANVSGIILTKLDGTAKGGIAVAIQSELDIPVKYIGVGESIDDLQKFDADAFVNALFDVDHKENPDAY